MKWWEVLEELLGQKSKGQRLSQVRALQGFSVLGMLCSSCPPRGLKPTEGLRLKPNSQLRGAAEARNISGIKRGWKPSGRRGLSMGGAKHRGCPQAAEPSS